MRTLLTKPADNANLSGMTKAQLLDYAVENGISGVNSSMLKAEIYDIIIANQ